MKDFYSPSPRSRSQRYTCRNRGKWGTLEARVDRGMRCCVYDDGNCIGKAFIFLTLGTTKSEGLAHAELIQCITLLYRFLLYKYVTLRNERYF
jgi:hypothetical protein